MGSTRAACRHPPGRTQNMQSALFLKMELTRKIHPLTFFLPGTVTPTKERKTVQEILKNYTFRDFQYILKNTNKHASSDDKNPFITTHLLCSYLKFRRM
jgi:hypothetical protein